MSKISVGGQALIEGVMMKGPDSISMAVRKLDGEIIIKNEPVSKIEKSKIVKIPIIRGVVALINSMITGVRSLTYSAQFFEEGYEEENKGKFELWMEKKFGDKSDEMMTYLSVALAFVMAIGIFMFIPTFVINFLKTKIDNSIVLSGLEGILKIIMFLTYILLISRLKDIQRVFQYHGAEHKTIHCYESDKPLTAQNAMEFSRLHPRCGTSFLLIVMTISILIFSFLGWGNPFLRVLMKLLLLPIVAGISYEIIKFSSKSKSKIMGAISYPGLMLQKLTTKEPDEKQLEVAITALKNAINIEADNEVW